MLRRLFTSTARSFAWKRAEYDKLTRIIAECPLESINWEQLTKEFPGKTASDISLAAMIPPDEFEHEISDMARPRKRVFTKEMDKQLLELLKAKRVSEEDDEQEISAERYSVDVTKAQMKSRFAYLNVLPEYNTWTKEEEEYLMKVLYEGKTVDNASRYLERGSMRTISKIIEINQRDELERLPKSNCDWLDFARNQYRVLGDDDYNTVLVMTGKIISKGVLCRPKPPKRNKETTSVTFEVQRKFDELVKQYESADDIDWKHVAKQVGRSVPMCKLMLINNQLKCRYGRYSPEEDLDILSVWKRHRYTAANNFVMYVPYLKIPRNPVSMRHRLLRLLAHVKEGKGEGFYAGLQLDITKKDAEEFLDNVKTVRSLR